MMEVGFIKWAKFSEVGFHPMAENHNPPAIESQSVTCTYQQVIGCHAEVTKLLNPNLLLLSLSRERNPQNIWEQKSQQF